MKSSLVLLFCIGSAVSAQAAITFTSEFALTSSPSTIINGPITQLFGTQGTYNIYEPGTTTRMIDIRFDSRGGGNTSILWNGGNALTYSTAFNNTMGSTLTLTGNNQLLFAPTTSGGLNAGAVWGRNYYLVQDGDPNSSSSGSPVLLGFDLIDNNGDGSFNSGDEFVIVGAAYDPSFESDLAVNMITADDGVMAIAAFPPVPEPSRVVLLSLGLLGIFARRRRS